MTSAVISTPLAWASSYAHAGWSVVPVHDFGRGRCSCRRLICPSPAKHPRIRWEGAQLRAATEDEVRAWWERWPSANVGVLTGRVSRLVVLDIDPRNRGMNTLARLTSRYGPLPDTPMSKTGGAGLHLVLQAPPGSVPCQLLGEGVEIKAEGGLVVFPPSLHASGERYRWVPDRSPADLDPAPMPDWLVERIYRQSEGADRPSFSVRTRGERKAFAEAWRRAGVELEDGDHHYLCPFHPDHHPSLHIDAEGCRWYCFGCHQGGGIHRLLELVGEPTSPRPRQLIRGGRRLQDVTLLGTHQVYVVGESTHQDELLTLTGGRRSYGGVDLEVVANLTLVGGEQGSCIEVAIKGQTVGTLREIDAARYGPLIESILDQDGFVTCRAHIRGGWDRGHDDVAAFGVVLDLPETFEP